MRWPAWPQGETKTFTAELGGGKLAGLQADVTVTVHSVKVKELPELDDEFAQSASEFDTLGELRAGTRTQLETMRRSGQAEQARERALDALLARLEIPLPDGLVDQEIELRRQSLDDRLDRSGSDLDGYLEAIGTTAENSTRSSTTTHGRSVKAGFILDKLAAAGGARRGPGRAERVRRPSRPTGWASRRTGWPRSSPTAASSAPAVADVLRGKALTPDRGARQDH